MTWGCLKYGGVEEQQWWGLAAGSCEVGTWPFWVLTGLRPFVRSLSKQELSTGKAWGGEGEGTRSICSTGEQFFWSPIRDLCRLVRNGSTSLFVIGTPSSPALRVWISVNILDHT